MTETIKTLAMLKMEKNFAAVLEKGYPRKPYEKYTLTELFRRLQEEVGELGIAIECPSCGDHEYYPAMKECADVSNIIDYIFKRLARRNP